MKSPKFLAIAVIIFAVGCGTAKEAEESVTPAPPPSVKLMLEGVSRSGELGSGAEEIRKSIAKLKETDPAKGNALSADLSALEKMTDRAKIKAKAKEMVGKL
jgi:hypothetical protein